MNCFLSVFVTFLCITYSLSSYNVQFARARIESCPGCQLNRLPEVRKFIFEDVPNYQNVEFKKIQGAPPELVLLNESDEEVERIELKSLNRKECNDLLKSKGFVATDNDINKEL